jgi:phage terminase small subunit
LPTNVVKLRNKAGHTRPVNQLEPQFDGEATPTAEILANPVALALWTDKAPELIEKGILTNQDQTAFVAYCLQHALRMKFWHLMESVGEEMAIAKGYFKAYQTADAACMRWSAKFGLNPSDRSAIKAAPKEKPQGARRFLA